MLKSYSLEQGVIQQIGDTAFHSTRYTVVRFLFPAPQDGVIIKDVPTLGFEPQGQIVNMRITSDSGNVEFTLHSRHYDECIPFGIVQQGITENEPDATTNELWTQWDVSTKTQGDNKPLLYVSCKELSGNPGKCRVELLIST